MLCCGCGRTILLLCTIFGVLPWLPSYSSDCANLSSTLSPLLFLRLPGQPIPAALFFFCVVGIDFAILDHVDAESVLDYDSWK